MNTQQILKQASEALIRLRNQPIDVLTIHKPKDFEYAKHLARVVSKLSPLIGNMLEYSIILHLNKKTEWKDVGDWIRQDPGFPDALFVGKIDPKPGIEIKTWFPLATEITARFKDSIIHFDENQTNVAVIAWLPEHIIYGKPKIIDVWVDSALSLAEARDKHYHNPPDYLVFEPEDTTSRTVNLQQTNTNGFKFQGTPEQLKEAEIIVESWGEGSRAYQFNRDYQAKLKSLLGKFPYRLDTNFAKIDRIEHPGLEMFKKKVLTTEVQGHSILNWAKVISSENEEELNKYLFDTLASK